MRRQGDRYTLTYDDQYLPKHYGWKWSSDLAEIRREYEAIGAPSHDGEPAAPEPLAERASEILRALDDGRWFSVYNGERLTGQPKFAPGERYLSSELFSRNLTTLSRYLATLP